MRGQVYGILCIYRSLPLNVFLSGVVAPPARMHVRVHTHTHKQIFVMARRLVPEGIKILLSFDSFLMDLNLLGSYPTK